MIAAAIALASWLVGPASARAKMMVHYDLTSLAFQSDAIVLARRVPSGSAQPNQGAWPSAPVRHVVVKSFAGNLHPDEVVDVFYSGYDLEPAEWSRHKSVPAGTAIDDEVILFLKKNESATSTEPYSLVASGLRVQLAGKVFRFEQFDNPGPYIPVPQGHDPLDLYEDRAGSDPLTLEDFEVDLLKAIARAGRVHEAVRAPADHRRELVELVGPTDGDLATARVIAPFSFWYDAVATAALEAIGRTKDIALYLEAVSRLRGGVRLSARPFEAEHLAAYAVDPAAPLRRRVAALSVLASDTLVAGSVPEKRVLGLLADPSPEIRIGAALALSPDERRPSIVAAFFDRWTVEKEEGVLSALLEQAQRQRFAARLPRISLLDPFVRVRRRGLAIRIEWSALDAGTPWNVTGATVEVRRANEVVRSASLTLEEVRSSWSSNGFGGAEIVPPIAALEPGTYDVRLTMKLTRGDVTVDRAFTLAPLTVRGPDDPDVELPGPPAQPPVPIDIGEAKVHGGGCHCTTAADGGPSLWWAAGLVLLGLRRRPRRSVTL